MESKTIIYTPDSNAGGANLLGYLAPLMQKNGVDPNVLLAMNNRNGGWGNDGGSFLWVIFLLFLFGGYGNGFGGFGGFGGRGAGAAIAGDAALANFLNNNDSREILMQAIQGNGNRLGELASSLNCSIGQVNQAINGVLSAIQGVGNQVGMSGMQIINAIQAGNTTIAQQIADCCCENRLSICNQTNTLQNSINSVAIGQERGFSSIEYNTSRQTCDITNAIKDSTEKIVAGQRAAEMREMQRDLTAKDERIAALTTQLTTEHQTAQFGQMIGQAVSPLIAGQQDFSARLAKIECNQPEVAKVPYSPVVGVPTCVAANYGLYGGFPGNYGGNPFWV